MIEDDENEELNKEGNQNAELSDLKIKEKEISISAINSRNTKDTMRNSEQPDENY